MCAHVFKERVSPFFWAPMGIISFPYTVLSLIFVMRKESNKSEAETPSNTPYSIRLFDIFSLVWFMCSFQYLFLMKAIYSLCLQMLEKLHHITNTLQFSNSAFCTTLYNQYFTHFAFSYVLEKLYNIIYYCRPLSAIF
jgi:hypothetical protein